MKALIPLLAAAFVVSIATADEQPMRNPNAKSMQATQVQFEALDRNHDQQLSKAEASADRTITAQFSSVDVNTDGYVSKTEYVAYAERSATEPEQPQPHDRAPPPPDRQ